MRKLFILLSALLVSTLAYASVSVVVNGTSYTIPQTNERGWGSAVTSWIQAVSSSTVQPTGGTFTLTADLDFGANFGLKSLYYKSESSNLASTGVFRLSNGDSVAWRDNANSGNLLLGPLSSNLLGFNGIALVNLSASQTLTNKTLSGNTASSLINGSGTLNVNSSGTVTLPNATDTLVGKATTDVLTNKSISGSTNTLSAIPDSSLNTISTALKVSNSATTATNANTASAIVARDASGNFTAGTVTAALTGNVTGNVTGNLTGNVTGNASGTSLNVTGTVAIGNGGTGQTTKAAGFDALSPMSASGDLIYGGTSGTGTRLPKSTDGKILTLSSGLPTWQNNTGANLVAPTVQKFTSGSGNYTTPANVLYFRVKISGSGGAGAGGGGGAPNGANGNDTTFGTCTASGGGQGLAAAGSVGGAGGAATLGSGYTGTALTGGPGAGAPISGSPIANSTAGGNGGSNPLGGAGMGAPNGTGRAGSPNTGAGGAGGGANPTGNVGGAGGGAGGYIEAIFVPTAGQVIAYSVGASVAGATAGTNGSAGTASGSGYIEVTEYYQ